jgi:uncharacterized protein (DUF1800 family)
LAPPYENTLIDQKRTEALWSWWVSRLINRDYSLTEKMIVFWHNHFPVEMDVVKDSRYGYTYLTLLRRNALGNYKNLILEGTTNPAMLVYLNGNGNKKLAPNENYSRELMELFTLGKTSDVKYTEDDVKAGARALTGWVDDKQNIRSNFHADLHDTGDKHFSAFFDNRVIKGRHGDDGKMEVNDLVDMIFTRQATARFFCRNIYRWFVCAQLDEQTESQVIEPLAQTLIQNNFEVIPVLRRLLGSKHFFDPVFRGGIEKSPVDFLVGVIRQYGLAYPEGASENLLCSFLIHDFMAGLSMNLLNPPSVAGWPAYYQAPKYHQWWINPSSVSIRMDLIKDLTSDKEMNCNGPKIKLDLVAFANSFETPEDAGLLVENCAEMLFAVSIPQNIKERYKAILQPVGASQQSWGDIWKKHAGNPTAENKTVVETRLREFLRAMMNSIPYQMS